MVAHTYKDYSNYGTVLRTILDTFVYLKNVSVDMDYVATECERLGITEFEAVNRLLALHFFGGEQLTEEEQHMLGYAIASGTYGDEQHRAEKALEEKGRRGYFLSRLTYPLPVM